MELRMSEKHANVVVTGGWLATDSKFLQEFAGRKMGRS